MSERDQTPVTNEELEALLVDNQAHHVRSPDAYALASEVVALATELRERRAQDLTAEEVEALHWAMWSMRDDRDRDGRNAMDTAEWAPRWRRAETLLLKLIAAAETRRG